MTMTMVRVPETLNGYPVIKSEVHANGYVTIMVSKPEGGRFDTAGGAAGRKVSEFVVATWWPDLTTGWSWGHYFMVRDGDEELARQKANSDFFETASRNARR